jgi:predicted transcriptional regulator
MPKAKQPNYTGPRGVGAEVTMSFMVTKDFRRRVHAMASYLDQPASEFIRQAIEESLERFEKGKR